MEDCKDLVQNVHSTYRIESDIDDNRIENEFTYDSFKYIF